MFDVLRVIELNKTIIILLKNNLIYFRFWDYKHQSDYETKLE
jgi:hypothetical protein